MDDYAVVIFEQKLEEAMSRARLVLEETKMPTLPSASVHDYEDKFAMAEFASNAALAAQVNCLSLLGLGSERLEQLKGWAHGGSAVSLRFRAKETYSFLREATREVEQGGKRTVETTNGDGCTSVVSRVTTTVTEYFWRFSVSYELQAVRGVGAEAADRLQILARTGSVEVKTTSKAAKKGSPPLEEEANVTELLKLLPLGSATPGFRIDRCRADCRTPRCNADMDRFRKAFQELADFVSVVREYLEELLTERTTDDAVDVQAAVALEPLVMAVAPFLRSEGGAEEGEEPSPALLASMPVCGERPLAPASANALLREELRLLQERLAQVREALPSSDAVATAAEGVMVVVLKHSEALCERWSEAAQYLEDLLKAQLIAALGEEVGPSEFGDYMRFHYKRLFKEDFAPQPFCLAVRRSPLHAPEGTVSLEKEGMVEEEWEGVESMVSEEPSPPAMAFRISASSTVRFAGQRFLHAWLDHSFTQSCADLRLVASARQFSSMIVLVGRIASATVFEPTHAALVQNKEELRIPLQLASLPTPQEFRDAIESLSAKQQAFAKAFRAMQLQSTLFGVLVVHVKPQLETVLNLPADSLAKEIKLTQDLLQLFTKYQIPSDLLSYDAEAAVEGAEMVGAATGPERLEAVRAHTKAMMEMIDEAKKEELQDREQEARYAEPEPQRTFPIAACGAMPCRVSAGLAMGCFGARVPARVMCAAAMPCAAQAPVQRWQPEAPAAGAGLDYTQVPKVLDEKAAAMDPDGTLRPGVITALSPWKKRCQKGLLAAPEERLLQDVRAEKEAAFGLLDALTKSGALPLEHAALHVVVAGRHCFRKCITEALIQEDENPIEKVERSALIMAAAVHRRPAAELLKPAEQARLRASCPSLFQLEGEA